jgi:shikimate kinase
LNILLCGLPCSGKTTIGRRLSQRINSGFLDTDCLIEQLFHHKNLTCRQVFLSLGQEQFRSLEKSVIESLRLEERTVIALGGGVLETPGIFSTLHTLGTIIYLQVPSDILWKRIEERGIPAYLDHQNPYGSFLDLVQRRSPLYEAIADITIDTQNFCVEEVEEKISPFV